MSNDGFEFRCVIRYKDTNLKAIHNLKLWHKGVVIFYQPEST